MIHGNMEFFHRNGCLPAGGTAVKNRKLFPPKTESIWAHAVGECRLRRNPFYDGGAAFYDSPHAEKPVLRSLWMKERLETEDRGDDPVKQFRTIIGDTAEEYQKKGFSVSTVEGSEINRPGLC